METDTRADEMAYVPIAERELDLIRTGFAENDALLKATRALFLGLNPTKQERDMVRNSYTPELIAIVRQRFMPSMNKSAEIGTLQDVWLGVESMVFGQPKETQFQAVAYKALAIEMTEKALALLENPDGEAPDIAFNPKQYVMDEQSVFLLARNMFIRHVEKQLGFLKLIAAQKKSSPREEEEKRLADSAA